MADREAEVLRLTHGFFSDLFDSVAVTQDEASASEARREAAKLYMAENLLPLLVPATRRLLAELATQQRQRAAGHDVLPINPLNWLAQYLFRHNPRFRSGHQQTRDGEALRRLAASERERWDFTGGERPEIKALFDRLDADGDGRLSLADLEETLPGAGPLFGFRADAASARLGGARALFHKLRGARPEAGLAEADLLAEKAAGIGWDAFLGTVRAWRAADYDREAELAALPESAIWRTPPPTPPAVSPGVSPGSSPMSGASSPSSRRTSSSSSGSDVDDSDGDGDEDEGDGEGETQLSEAKRADGEEEEDEAEAKPPLTHRGEEEDDNDDEEPQDKDDTQVTKGELMEFSRGIMRDLAELEEATAAAAKEYEGRDEDSVALGYEYDADAKAAARNNDEKKASKEDVTEEEMDVARRDAVLLRLREVAARCDDDVDKLLDEVLNQVSADAPESAVVVALWDAERGQLVVRRAAQADVEPGDLLPDPGPLPRRDEERVVLPVGDDAGLVSVSPPARDDAEPPLVDSMVAVFGGALHDVLLRRKLALCFRGVQSDLLARGAAQAYLTLKRERTEADVGEFEDLLAEEKKQQQPEPGAPAVSLSSAVQIPITGAERRELATLSVAYDRRTAPAARIEGENAARRWAGELCRLAVGFDAERPGRRSVERRFGTDGLPEEARYFALPFNAQREAAAASLHHLNAKNLASFDTQLPVPEQLDVAKAVLLLCGFSKRDVSTWNAAKQRLGLGLVPLMCELDPSQLDVDARAMAAAKDIVQHVDGAAVVAKGDRALKLMHQWVVACVRCWEVCTDLRTREGP